MPSETGVMANLLRDVGLVLQDVASLVEEGKAYERAAEAAEGQDLYALDVLNLIHVANEIRAGRADKLAHRIEDLLPEHLREMGAFQESSVTILATHQAGQLLESSGKEIPADLKGRLAAAGEKAKQLLSEDCFVETVCDGGPGCHRWPTSLPDIDPTTPNPMGWRYIVGSHCGFRWPRFWKLDCGNPKGLVACTG